MSECVWGEKKRKEIQASHFLEYGFKCRHVLLQLWKYPDCSLPALLIVVPYDTGRQQQWKLSFAGVLRRVDTAVPATFLSLLIRCCFLTIWSCCAEAAHKQFGVVWPTPSPDGAHAHDQMLYVKFSMLQYRYTCKNFLIKEVVFTLLSQVLVLDECHCSLKYPFLYPFYIFSPSLHQPFILHHPPSSHRGEHPWELHIGRVWGGEGGAEREESVF